MLPVWVNILKMNGASVNCKTIKLSGSLKYFSFSKIVWFKVLVSTFLFSGCVEERDSLKSIIPVGSKQFLSEWPDELYINQMDSLLKEEVVVGPVSKNDVSLTMGGIPSLESLAKKAVAEGEGQARVSRKSLTTKMSVEEFLSKFQNKLDLVRSGESSGRYVLVSNEGKIMAILAKAYGHQANNIPGVLIDYHLQSINPEIDLNNLTSGTKVLLPF
tara:strand:- start:266 stop:913 length:648 start_codon:yes stop_codon:yes gene_type:complete